MHDDEQESPIRQPDPAWFREDARYNIHADRAGRADATAAAEGPGAASNVASSFGASATRSGNAGCSPFVDASSGAVAASCLFPPIDGCTARRAAGVVFTSFGYPRSISQSVSLQTLRRISEETGGTFLEADNNFDLPQGFTNQPYNSIDNGGQITIKLQQLFSKVTSADNQLILTFETDTRETAVSIPISIPYEPIQKLIETKIVQVPSTPQSHTSQSPIKIVTVQSPQEKTFGTWLWYGIPVALLVLILLTIATFFITLKRPGAKQEKGKTDFYDFKPYAYLVVNHRNSGCETTSFQNCS